MRISIRQIPKSVMVMTALALAGLLAGGILLWLQRGNQWMPVSVTVQTVSTINKPLHIKRSGSAVRATMSPVYSLGAGHVSDVYVAVGQVVKVDQPLVKLEITAGAK